MTPKPLTEPVTLIAYYTLDDATRASIDSSLHPLPSHLPDIDHELSLGAVGSWLLVVATR